MSDWFYSADLRQYTIQSALPNQPRPRVNGAASGTTESWIKAAMQNLLRLDDQADAAEITGEEVLAIGDAKAPCYVVAAKRTMSYRKGVNSTIKETFWIDENTGLVRKAVEYTTGPRDTHDPTDDQKRTVEIIYNKVELDSPPDPALFVFHPPEGAYLADDARHPEAPPVRVGQPAPELKLKENNGTAFELANLKGKVVLVTFWASWCGGCTQEMKELAMLPKSYGENGFAIVSVDEDENPQRGDEYFATQKYAWQNLHDPGETYRRIWGAMGYPQTFLIDRQGTVVWTSSGFATRFGETLRSQLQRPELALAL